MLYQKFEPAEPFTPLVLCFFVWQQHAGDALEFESPPSGYGSIVFNLGGGYSIQNKKYNQLRVPDNFMAGQATQSYRLSFTGHIDQVGIVFRPAGLASIFNIPMFSFVDERISLASLLPVELVENTASLLKQAASPEEKATLLNDFLADLLTRQPAATDYIDEAANQIVDRNGIIRVDDLIAQSFMARRTFERKFLYKVGLSPKYYARIRRISYLCNLIAGKSTVDWQEILHHCEYYDQTHFIKDFKSFTGRSPVEYLEQNVELKKYLKAQT